MFDESGNGNHGENNGETFINNELGDLDKAIKFDEPSNVLIGDPELLDFQPTDSFSLGGWIKVSKTYVSMHGYNYDSTSTFIGRGGGLESVGIGVLSYWDNDTQELNSLKFITGSRSVSQITFLSSDISLNNFYHVFFVYTPGMQYTYINGELVDSRDNSAGLGGSFSGDWEIYWRENCPGGNDANMAGIADDIRIYNKSFSEEEVKQIYWDSLKNLNEGSHKVSLNNCNLKKEQKYEILAVTDNQALQKEVIAK